jgi:hypothetical protein
MALGDLATWVGAGATVGLLIGAVITARYAIRAFREQRNEVCVLRKQLELDIEKFNQETERRQQAQAATVFVELETPKAAVGWVYTATVHNMGDAPIVQLEIRWYKASAETPVDQMVKDRLKFLRPNESHKFERSTSSHLRPVVYFDDAAGIRWQREPGGEPKKLDTP